MKLLAQYKSLMKLVGDDIGGVETFMKRFKVSQMAELQSMRVDVDDRWTTRRLCIV